MTTDFVKIEDSAKITVRDEYVSLNSSTSPNAIMLRETYNVYAKKILTLASETRALISAVHLHDSLPHAVQAKRVNPFDKLNAAERQTLKEQLVKADLGEYITHDMGVINADLKAGKKGYKTPVYQVNGRYSILGDFYDAFRRTMAPQVAEVLGIAEKTSQGTPKNNSPVRKL
jgi:hypothetical protein